MKFQTSKQIISETVIKKMNSIFDINIGGSSGFLRNDFIPARGKAPVFESQNKN